MWLMDSSRLRGSAVISPDPVRVNLESVSRLHRLLIPSITQSSGSSLAGSSILVMMRMMAILISNGNSGKVWLMCWETENDSGRTEGPT